MVMNGSSGWSFRKIALGAGICALVKVLRDKMFSREEIITVYRMLRAFENLNVTRIVLTGIRAKTRSNVLMAFGALSYHVRT